MGTNDSPFTPDEIIKFHNVMNISEKDLKENPYGFKMNEGAIEEFKRKHQLTIKSSSDIVEHNNVNCILYSKNRETRGASFIAHIRNAYVHSNISVEGDEFIIKDYKDIYQNKRKVDKKMTAYGRIKRDLLLPFIDCMLEDRNNNINN